MYLPERYSFEQNEQVVKKESNKTVGKAIGVFFLWYVIGVAISSIPLVILLQKTNNNDVVKIVPVIAVGIGVLASCLYYKRRNFIITMCVIYFLMCGGLIGSSANSYEPKNEESVVLEESPSADISTETNSVDGSYTYEPTHKTKTETWQEIANGELVCSFKTLAKDKINVYSSGDVKIDSKGLFNSNVYYDGEQLPYGVDSLISMACY